MSDATPPSAPAPSSQTTSRWTRVAARVLTVVGVVLAIVTMVAGYLRWQLFDTDTFERTAAELIANEDVRDEVAATMVEQLYTNVDVEELLAERLPDDQQGLAGPISGALRLGADRVAERLLERPRIQALWTESATVAQRQLLRVLEDDFRAISTQGGVVVLDLRPLVLELGDQVAIFGRLAEVLPQDAGRVELVESDELETAQDVTSLFRTVATWIWILPLLCWGAALWLARGRRRAELRAIAIGIAIAGLVVLVARRVVGSYVVDELVATESVKPAAQSAYDIVTSLLKDGAWSGILLGVVALVGVWLTGANRRAVQARAWLAPWLRRADVTYGAVAVALLLFVWWGPIAQSRRWAYMLVGTALLCVGVEVLRRVVAREHPAPPDGAPPPASPSPPAAPSAG